MGDKNAADGKLVQVAMVAAAREAVKEAKPAHLLRGLVIRDRWHMYITSANLAGRLGRFTLAMLGARSTSLPKLGNTEHLRPFEDGGSGIYIAKGRNMTNGTVKFYNDQKGFGFIAPDEGGNDVFVHATALERAGIHHLSEGQKVEFETQRDQRSGKMAVSTLQIA
jgi:CspA family cold shock protein